MSQGSIGDNALRAMGARACAVEIAPLSKREPMPLPPWACGVVKLCRGSLAGVLELLCLLLVALMADQRSCMGQIPRGTVAVPQFTPG